MININTIIESSRKNYYLISVDFNKVYGWMYQVLCSDRYYLKIPKIKLDIELENRLESNIQTCFERVLFVDNEKLNVLNMETFEIEKFSLNIQGFLYPLDNVSYSDPNRREINEKGNGISYYLKHDTSHQYIKVLYRSQLDLMIKLFDLKHLLFKKKLKSEEHIFKSFLDLDDDEIVVQFKNNLRVSTRRKFIASNGQLDNLKFTESNIWNEEFASSFTVLGASNECFVYLATDKKLQLKYLIKREWFKDENSRSINFEGIEDLIYGYFKCYFLDTKLYLLCNISKRFYCIDMESRKVILNYDLTNLIESEFIKKSFVSNSLINFELQNLGRFFCFFDNTELSGTHNIYSECLMIFFDIKTNNIYSVDICPFAVSKIYNIKDDTSHHFGLILKQSSFFNESIIEVSLDKYCHLAGVDHLIHNYVQNKIRREKLLKLYSESNKTESEIEFDNSEGGEQLRKIFGVGIVHKPLKDSSKFLVFDTETTGLPIEFNKSPEHTNNWPRIVQLSWQVLDEDLKVLHKKNYIVKPDGYEIPEESIKIHGITNTVAKKKGLDLGFVLQQFFKDLKNVDFLVAHNINFDKNTVHSEFYRIFSNTNNQELSQKEKIIGINKLFEEKHLICTQERATNYCKIPGNYGFKFPSLHELHTHLFNKPFEGAHNSMNDVYATTKCFKSLIQKEVIKLKEFDKNESSKSENDDLPF